MSQGERETVLMLKLQHQGTGYSLQANSDGESDGTNQTRTLTDIAFGDVWLCSGQSNMVFVLKVGTGLTGQERNNNVFCSRLSGMPRRR